MADFCEKTGTRAGDGLRGLGEPLAASSCTPGDCRRLMGLEAPFGVAEKTSERGYALLAFVCCLSAVQHTTRVSRGFAFLAVLGVFPRSFAGVLNVSAKFLRDHQPSF